MSIITTRTLQRLWQDAQHYPEWATVRLWEHIFNRIAFSGDPWLVSSRQPPTLAPGDLRRVDLVVEQADHTQGIMVTRLFMGAKRASAKPSDILTIELQAYTAACASALDSNSKEPIWVMTCVGSAAKLWIFDWNQDFLVPFLPTARADTKMGYVEISKGGTELLKHLCFIKKHPRPPKCLLRRASPRPNVGLPADWPDDEVVLRDAQHRHVGCGADGLQDGGYGLSTTSPALTSFTTGKGHEKSTVADDWREARHRGKKAWHYLHKGAKYCSREKPGV